MKRFIKNLLLTGADILGVNAVFRIINDKKVRVLMYHGVTKTEFDPPYWTQLNIGSFKWQMQYIGKYFTPMAASRIGIGNPPQNGVVITFDDGLQNVFDNALPVLEDLNLKAVCFVLPELSGEGKAIWPDRIYEVFMHSRADKIVLSEFDLPDFDIKNRKPEYKARRARELTGELKSRPHDFRRRVIEHLEAEYYPEGYSLNPEFKPMTLDQINSVSESDLFEIGLHTNTHPILSTQSRGKQALEISGCKKSLDEAGVKYINIFAYPNGRNADFNQDSIDILKDNGLRAALTTEDGFYGTGDDLYRIKRIPVGCDMGRREFAARLSGFYYFIRRLWGN